MAKIQPLKDIPELLVQKLVKPAAVPGFDCRASYKFYYESQEHANLPHVVKFSGGRSSGMLLFVLLQNGILNAERGDVVIFNNTSAEHSATYNFVAKCKEMTENSYGIPFFWVEFQTYEDARNGMWTRVPSYKLVNAKPCSANNPDGYKRHGEVFEEMLSFKSYVPNQYSRTCTATMKIETTREFLKDWFAMKPEIGRRGHYYEQPMQTADSVVKQHYKNGGSTPLDVFIEKKKFVMSCSPCRPAQKYSDFTKANINVNNVNLEEKGLGGRVSFSGSDCVEYLSFVGFRADEPQRVAKMLARNRGEQPGELNGEHVYAPLMPMGVCREDINEFWRAQSWGLDLPYDQNMSNCVFCFLKGTKNIMNIIVHQEQAKITEGASVAPSDISWWVSMEEKYGRDLVKEGRSVKKGNEAEKPIIGFFGNNFLSYGNLVSRVKNRKRDAGDSDFDTMPCECTD